MSAKRKLFLIVIGLLCVLSLFVVAGCADRSPAEGDISQNTQRDSDIAAKQEDTPSARPEEAHEHTFESGWHCDQVSHYHQATCAHDVRDGQAAHVFDEGTVTRPATEKEEGVIVYTCTVCGYTKEQAIEALSHSHVYGNWTYDDSEHYRLCACGEKGNVGAHVFDDGIEIRPATEEEEGLIEYTCTVCGYTKEQTITIDVPQHNHVFGNWTYDGSEHYRQCACGEKGEVGAHIFDEGTVIRPATEQEAGVTVYTCTVCGYTKEQAIEALPHSHAYGNWAYNDSEHYRQCVCGEKGELGAHVFDCGYLTIVNGEDDFVCYTCGICGYQKKESTRLALHSFDGGVEYPQEGEEGKRVFTCSHCGIVYEHWHRFATTISYDSKTHFYGCECGARREERTHIFDDGIEIRPATEEEEGLIEYTCTVCGYTRQEYTDPLPHEHNFDKPYSYDEAYHYIVCTCGEWRDFGTHTLVESVERSLSTMQDGLHVRSCSVCGYREEIVIPRVELSFALTDDAQGYEVSLREFPSEDFDLIVPAEHDGLPVTTIADRAFNSGNGSKYIQSVTLPDTIVSIGQSAFANTKSLTSLVIPMGVQTIGWGVLFGSGVRTLSLPSSLVALSGDFSMNDNLTFNVYDNACYLGNDENPYLVLVKATQKYVTSCEIHPDCRIIAAAALSGCNAITQIDLPHGLTRIEESAFAGCTALREVSVPDTLVYVGTNAFERCAALQYNTYENGAYLGNEGNPYHALMAAYDGGLGTYNRELHTHEDCVMIATEAYCYTMGNSDALAVTLTDGVRYVNGNAFFNANVRHLTIGAGLSLGGDTYFAACPIEDIVVAADNPYMVYENGVLYSKDKRTVLLCRTAANVVTVADGVTDIAPYAFYYDTWLTSISLPDSVQAIGEYAFGFCVNARDFTLPEGLRYIHQGGLYRCAMSVDGLVLPQGLRTIGAYAFCDDVNIKGALTIPDSCEVVGYHAFDGCENIRRLVMTRNTAINDAFYYSNVTTVLLGDAVTSVDWLNEPFAFDHLESIEVADGNAVFYAESGYLCRDGEIVVVPYALSGEVVIRSRFGENAFAARRGITSVVIDNDMTSIPAYAFSGCIALREIEIRNAAVTYIGNDAFANCTALETLPEIDGLTEIAQGVVSGCTRLETLCIGKDVVEINANAFSGLPSLKSIRVHADNPYYVDLDGVLYNKAMTTLIKCPPRLTVEGTFAVPNSVRSIRNYAFENCLWLEEITLECNAGAYAFEGCLNLRSVTIGEGVQSLAQGLFRGCVGLASVVMHEGINGIAAFMFDDCSALASVDIPASVQTIGDFAFRGCTSLRAVTFAADARLESIASLAFAGCRLRDVVLPEGLTAIQFGAFQSNQALLIIELPSSLATIDDFAFDGCQSLHEVVNHSALPLVAGAADFGGVAQYAASVITDRSLSTLTSENGFVTKRVEDDVVLLKYIGDDWQITVPEDVTVIADYAFAGNDRLARCTIPAGVKSIGDGAFQNCSAIVQVSLPATLETFGNNVFLGCEKLTELVNPSTLDLAGDFYINRYAPAVLTGAAESEIYQENGFILRAHEGEKILIGYVGEDVEIVIPADIDKVGHHALYRSAVEKVTVAADIETLEPYTFGLCTRLRELRFGTAVTYVDTLGIERNYALSEIYFDGTVAQFETIMTPESASYYAGVIPLTEYLSPRTTIHCTDGTLTGTGAIV